MWYIFSNDFFQCFFDLLNQNVSWSRGSRSACNAFCKLDAHSVHCGVMEVTWNLSQWVMFVALGYANSYETLGRP
jgi:hypothetical protein